MKTQPWQRQLAAYDYRHTLAPQYSHLDTVRHVNNVAAHGFHTEARIRHQLAILGNDSLFSDDVLLRPRWTATNFLRETHYPQDVTCAARLVAVDENGYRLATGLFQDGECVGVQDCLMGAWHRDRWRPLPEDVLAALHRGLAAEQLLSPAPEPPQESSELDAYPVKATISGRYADLDPDGCLGELAIARCAEQSRAGSLRPIREDADLGMLVARVDIRYDRWHRGVGRIETGCGVGRIGNSSFTLGGGVAVDGVAVASALSTMVLIDRVRRRPVQIGASLREAMEPLSMDRGRAGEELRRECGT